MTTDDELGRRIRRLAEALPVQMQEPPAATTVARSPRLHVVRRVVLVSSALAIVAVTGAVIATRDGSRPSRIGSVAPSELPTTNAPMTTSPPSTDVATTPSPPSPTTVAETTTTVPPASVTALESVTEPVIDLEGCSPTWGRVYPARIIDGFFARHSSLPIAFQVFGDPRGSLAEPFAMLMRIFADQHLNEVAEGSSGSVDINGSHGVLLWQSAIGRATLHWLLPDGSEAYLRSDSLDGDELLALARSLVARPTGAAVPGFDLADDHAPTIALLDQEFGSFPSAAVTTSECGLSNGAYLHVSIITSATVAAAATILDRGLPPRIALRQLDDGRLIFVSGSVNVAAFFAGAVDHVRQATAAEWATMTAYPTQFEITSVSPPIDTDAQYRLATRTYATPQEMSDALIAILQERVPEADAPETHFTTYSLYGTFASFVVSKNELDDSAVATRWLVMYEQDGSGQYSVGAVYQALLCRDGTVVTPDSAVCP